METIIIIAPDGRILAQYPFDFRTNRYRIQYTRNIQQYISEVNFRNFQNTVNLTVQRYYDIPSKDLDREKIWYVIITVVVFIFLHLFGVLLGVFFLFLVDSKQKQIAGTTKLALRNYFLEFRKINIQITFRGDLVFRQVRRQPSSSQGLYNYQSRSGQPQCGVSRTGGGGYQGSHHRIPSRTLPGNLTRAATQQPNRSVDGPTTRKAKTKHGRKSGERSHPTPVDYVRVPNQQSVVVGVNRNQNSNFQSRGRKKKEESEPLVYTDVKEKSSASLESPLSPSQNPNFDPTEDNMSF